MGYNTGTFLLREELLEQILKKILKAHEKLNNLNHIDNIFYLKNEYDKYLEKLFYMYDKQFMEDLFSNLLKEESFNPADFDNAWLMFASKYKNYGVVKKLIEDERVDPYAREDVALENTFIKNDPIMAELILSVYHKAIVNKKEDLFKHLINYAVNRGRYKMAQLLLNKLVQE